MDRQNEHYQQLLNAQHIQLGLLPKKRHFDRLFSESFALYIPKDMVSGDFYWVGQKHDMRYLVVGDCTGHGISASLTSVLALNLLEYIIMNKGLKRTKQILEEMDKRFIDCFMGINDESFDNPWIDLAIVAIDNEDKRIHFSSANRKLLLVNDAGKSTAYTSTGYPIGGWQIKTTRSFETTVIPFENGDRIYLGSDGFQDQFGGPRNKKFGSRLLHTTLTNNSFKSFEDQKAMLFETYTNWRGEQEQTDDVCIVGVKL